MEQIQQQITKKAKIPWDEITVGDLDKLMIGVEKFYEERPSKMNLVWLANTILKRLRTDKDWWANCEGIRGCLSSDTEILTSEGIKKISELTSKLNKLLCYDFKNKKTVYAESLLLDSGEKELYEITLSDGKKIKATLDHTFFVMRKDKITELKLKDIKEGDLLLCKKL